MTREEAIKAWDKWRKNGHSHSAMPNSMALVMAYNALRGPTREQVEAWTKCNECTSCKLCLWNKTQKCNGCKNEFSFNPISNFCPRCGRPLTDEAVDIVMKRLEENLNEA